MYSQGKKSSHVIPAVYHGVSPPKGQGRQDPAGMYTRVLFSLSQLYRFPPPPSTTFGIFVATHKSALSLWAKNTIDLGLWPPQTGNFNDWPCLRPFFPAKYLPYPGHKKPGGLWRDSPKAVRLFCIVSAAGARFRRFPCGSGGCGIPGVRGPRRR